MQIKHKNVPIDYLKINIGFDAWDAITEMINSKSLMFVRQLGIEIHLDSFGTLEQHRYLAKIIRSIEDAGMVRFSSKINPTSYTYLPAMNMKAYSVYELAFYNPSCNGVAQFV